MRNTLTENNSVYSLESILNEYKHNPIAIAIIYWLKNIKNNYTIVVTPDEDLLIDQYMFFDNSKIPEELKEYLCSRYSLDRTQVDGFSFTELFWTILRDLSYIPIINTSSAQRYLIKFPDREARKLTVSEKLGVEPLDFNQEVARQVGSELSAEDYKQIEIVLKSGYTNLIDFFNELPPLTALKLFNALSVGFVPRCLKDNPAGVSIESNKIYFMNIGKNFINRQELTYDDFLKKLKRRVPKFKNIDKGGES